MYEFNYTGIKLNPKEEKIIGSKPEKGLYTGILLVELNNLFGPRGGLIMNYTKFEKRMIIFVLLSDLVFSGLTYWAFRDALAFFPVCFGLFFVFLILTIGLLIDEYILPVKTFREISKNAIASIFFLVVCCLSCCIRCQNRNRNYQRPIRTMLRSLFGRIQRNMQRFRFMWN